MTLQELLGELAERKIQVSVENDNLRFRAPAGAVTAAIREQLRRFKPELLKLCGAGHLPCGPAGDAIPSVPVVDSYPLSSAQLRLWNAQQLTHARNRFHLCSAMEVAGPLRIPALHFAFAVVQAEQDALRTVFQQHKNEVRQKIQHEFSVDIAVVDISRSPEAVADRLIGQLVTTINDYPLPLEREPPWRVCCIRKNADRHAVVLAIHHIIADAWSIDVLFKRVSVIYNLLLRGLPARHERKTVRYVDFVSWRDRSLAAAESKLDEWRERLTDVQAFPPLPGHKPGVRSGSRKGNRRTVRLDNALISNLRELSADAGVSLFTVLLAGFKILVYHLTGCRDILVCIPVAAREHPDLLALIGYVNEIVTVRSRIDGATTINQFLQALQTEMTTTAAPPILPLERLSELQELRQIPLQRMLVTMQKYALPALDAVRIKRLEKMRGIVDFDMTLAFRMGRHQVTLIVEYPEREFSDETVDSYLQAFNDVLAQLPQHRMLAVDTLASPRDIRPLPSPSPSPTTAPAEDVEASAPHSNTLEWQLQRIWSDVMARSVGIDDNVFDLGANSFQIMRVFNIVRERFGKPLPLALILEAPTIRLFADRIEQDIDFRWRALVPIASGSGPPLFCVHGVAGNIVGYHPLASRLRRGQPVCGLQAVGMDGTRAPLTTVEAMATHYIAEIKTVAPHGPYLLCGHSFGGTVCYEMARQLSSAGEMAPVLAFFDTDAPRHLDRLTRVERKNRRLTSVRQRSVYHFERMFMRRPSAAIAHVRRRSQEIRRRIRNRIWRFRVNRQIDRQVEMPRTLWNVREACWAAAAAYNPGTYDGPIIVFRARQAGVGRVTGSTLGWERLSTGPIDVVDISGDHVSLLHEPHVRVVAQTLQRYIDRTQ